MNQDYHISSTGSHAVSALIAVVATALVLWLVFTVAGDYYAADEQAAAPGAQQLAHHDAPAQLGIGSSAKH